ncbi:DJ-1/PfpI family protein [Actinomadura latina]|uniref:DJ-1/PfpI family protein n=1 Tax=Actinomadura latina TaxID=163603 RepID=A0A846Z1K9_9ACTN|nr:DJ-1/PfpI family protein [Actinomadura latina]
MKVVIPLYDGFTALDAVGPYQMLASAPGTQVVFAAEQPGPVLDDHRTLQLTAVAFDEAPRPDVVVVPGGPGTVHVLDGALPSWLRDVHATTRWTTSVCSGSLILGAAGLIKGLRATTHYRHLDKLPLFGAVPTPERVVVEHDARVATAAGVSSGIDMALRLVELLTDARTAQAVQLWTEYDPQPPFDTGSPLRAPQDVLELAAEYDAAALDAATRSTEPPHEGHHFS